MKSNPLLTIYTPTYNREELLPRVYNSLKQQTRKDFVWVIIDDGSTDSTAEVVSEWQNECRYFEIQYVYKINEGVHTARDLAYRICDTELITTCDSDDWLAENAVERIIDRWVNRNVEKCLGIIVPDYYETGKRVDSGMPKVDTVLWQDLYCKYNCIGDTHWIFNSKYIKRTQNAPVFPGEKLVGEMYKTLQLPYDVPILLCDEPLFFVEYQPTGYSANAYKYLFENPNGFRADYDQLIKNARYIKWILKGYLGYIAASLFLEDKHYITDSNKPIITLLLTPAGWLALKYLANRCKHQTKYESK